MKKAFLMAAAVAAMTLASCGGGNKQDNAAGSAEATDAHARSGDDARTLTRQIAASLHAGDAQGVAHLLSQATERVATLISENPEQATAYVSQLQQYITDNADAITGGWQWQRGSGRGIEHCPCA